MRAKGLALGLGVAMSVFVTGWLGVRPALAISLYWVGADGANTSVGSNWKTSNPAGCGGGDAITAPISSDSTTFDADCDNGATINSAFSVESITFESGYAGTVTQATDVSITVGISGWTMNGGTFTGSNAAITISGTLDFTISGGTFTSTSGTFSLEGNWNRSGGTFTHNSGTVTFNGATAQTLTGETFYNLTINNSATTPSDSVDVDSSAAVTAVNTLTVTDGQFQPTTGSDFATVSIGANGILKPDSSASITVSGSWSNAGTWTANSGTVTFDGTSQALNDDNTFYNLTKSVTSADTLTLEASATQTVTNTTTMNGADCNVLSLRSSSSDTQWSINPQGTRTVSYLDVKDSNNTNATAMSCTTGCASSGNNTNWTLSGTTCSTSGSVGNTAPTASVPRSITQVGDTIEFKTDSNDVDGNKTQLLVEYSTNQSNWKKAKIDKVLASQGDATITQSATYPIASIDTDNGKIILTVTWNAKDNFASSEESKIYLRLTPYDGTDVGSTVISDSFALDTRAPVISDLYLKARTSTSLTPAWIPETEKNFDKYVLCYGTNLTDVKNCNKTAKQWTKTQDGTLTTFTAAQTTIMGLKKNTTYHILLKATDTYSHTSTLLLQSVVTSDAPASPFLTIAGVVGATIDLLWTETTSPTFLAYELCYGQDPRFLDSGFICPAGTARLTFTNRATTTTTLTGLKENSLYYAKIWLRDSKYSFIAGNTVSATTCKNNEVRVNDACTVPPPPPTPTPIPPTPTPVPPPATPTPPAPTEPPLPAPELPPVLTPEVRIKFIEEVFGEKVAEVVKNVIQAVTRAAQAVVAVVKAVAEIVPTAPAVVIPIAVATAVTVAASTGLVTVVSNFAREIFYLGQRLAQGLLGLAGARRRYPWGRVVDAETGTPLPQTIVRILDRQTQKLRDTAVTDAKGDFASLLPAGQYRFEAIKPGWHLDPAPARFLNILSNQTVYDGNFVDVKKEGVVSIIVAMRTTVRQEVTHIALRSILQRLERLFTALSWPLLIFGSILSALALVKEQTALNIGIGMLYVVLIGTKMYVQRNRQETTGQVKDAVTNQPLKEALVQLYNAETGRLMATKVTSVTGQFALVPPPGVYTVVVSKAGYQTYKESHVVIRPEKQAALAMTFTLTPEAPQADLAS